MIVNRRAGKPRKYSDIVHRRAPAFPMRRIISREHGGSDMKPVAFSHVPHAGLVEAGDFSEFDRLSHGLDARLHAVSANLSMSRPELYPNILISSGSIERERMETAKSPLSRMNPWVWLSMLIPIAIRGGPGVKRGRRGAVSFHKFRPKLP